MPDLTAFAVLPDLKRFLNQQRVKTAFTPSPAVAQSVMAQAQGGDPSGGGGMPPGMMPPGADPAAAAGPPGAPPPGGMPPEAMPPGMMPPGGDPAMEAAPPQPDPVSAKLDQLLQLIQAQQQQQQQQAAAPGGAGPAAGKPATASLKVEPAHFHQMSKSLENLTDVVTRIADMMGIQVPASKILNTPAAPAQSGGGASASSGGGGGDPSGGQQAAAQSPIAVQLPQLPPVAVKAARVAKVAAVGTEFGSVVSTKPGDIVRSAPLSAALKRMSKKGGKR